MSLFQKHWSPQQPEQWTIHELAACVLSAISYVTTAVGVAGTLLLQVWGFIALITGIVSAVLMYLVIDPKLKAMSEAFAKRQKEYIEHIDKTTRWEQ